MPIRFKVDRYIKKFEKKLEALNEITVSRSALLNNFDVLQSFVPGGFVIPVLKSNAYGHGITEVATVLKDRKFLYVAVDSFYEGLLVHNASKQPVLVMGAVLPGNFKRMSFKGIAFLLHDQQTAKALGKTKRLVKVHIEIETGMVRHGVTVDELPRFLQIIAKFPNIQVEGVMTHLADADNPLDDNFTNRQVNDFDKAAEAILAAGFKPKYFHIGQSAGSTKVVSKYANTIRPGQALYGINPLEPSDQNFPLFKDLQPVLELTSQITKITPVTKSTTVGYSRAFTAQKDTNIGVIPIGYYEGLPRALSNIGQVQCGQEYFKIAGKVCMNHTMIDLGRTKVNTGDKVTIISADKKSRNSLANLCKNFGLFNYGVLAGLNQNIRRRIVD